MKYDFILNKSPNPNILYVISNKRDYVHNFEQNSRHFDSRRRIYHFNEDDFRFQFCIITKLFKQHGCA